MSRRGDAVPILVDAVDDAGEVAAQVGRGHALIRRRRRLLVEHLPGVDDEALDGGGGLPLLRRGARGAAGAAPWR